MTSPRGRFVLSTLLAVAVAASAALAQSAAPLSPVGLRAAALRDEALAGNRALEIVRSLTVEVGPRSAGSPGDAAAVAWALRTLGGMSFDRVWSEKVMVPHWVRGSAEGAILTPHPQTVVLVALGGSVATPAAGLEAPVVMVDSLEALDALDTGQVAGKLVFFNGRMARTRDGSGYGQAVAPRGRGPAAVAKKGGIGMLLRSVGTRLDRLPHTGATRYEEGVPRIPAAALSGPDADLLEAQVASGKPVKFRLLLTSEALAEAESANVLAEVRGRDEGGEIVLLACHLDSWDLGHGALDDGAGCAIVIEAARRIGELAQPPRRTIRILLAANEEFGLSGARAYATAHQDEIGRHAIAAEADMGAGKVYRFSTHVGADALTTMAEIGRLLSPLGVEMGAGNDASGGADLIPLVQARVPVADLDQDASTYFDHHHSANDTFDKIVPEELTQAVAAYVTFAYLAAELPGPFGPAPEVAPR
jgi:carboxypeptidase Q